MTTIRQARTRDALLIAILSDEGRCPEGPLPSAATLASAMDYHNHDGSTAEEVTRDLARLAASGALVIADGRYRVTPGPPSPEAARAPRRSARGS
ncbi:MAG: hypothetical protein IT385_21415 [Deltaproteobacteria bacterium]|nr:hypothetical protein [Deltaproteobacteria bacterium]